jgi:hypothetical protein
MRIAISTENNAGLDSLVSPHFGHAPYFVLVDTEGDEIKSVSAVVNPFCGSHGCGDLAGFVASQAAQVMLVVWASARCRRSRRRASRPSPVPQTACARRWRDSSMASCAA